MRRPTLALARSLVAAASFALPSLADDEVPLTRDLMAVIALHGLPCGEVVAVMELAESDYVASCQDGNKYRVYVNSAGRVVVEKQK